MGFPYPTLTHIPNSLSPQRFSHPRRGILTVPKYSHDALQSSGQRKLEVLWGAGQSLVGLFLSDRTVRQGLDTSQRGGVRGGERRRRRKKKEG